MVSVTTRSAKGSELAWAEVDANFSDIAAGLNFLLPEDVAFSTAVPFTGNKYMPQTAVTGALAFTVSSSPVRGAHCYLRLVANGVNPPSFFGMKEWGGSAGYDDRAGIINELDFWYDGIDAWYCINQAVGAVPETGTASGATLTGVSAISAGTATGGGSGEAAGVTLTGSSSISAGTATGGSSATEPDQVTGLTLGTATSTTQPLTWTAPADGGSAITDYVVQWSPAGANTWTTFADGTSTATSATVTGLSATTSYDYRVAAVNSIGQGSYSATATGSTADISYTITGYNGSAVKTADDWTSATVSAPLTRKTSASLMTTSQYWNISPVPASARCGWGTSNTVPPAEITLAQNQNSGASINGLVPMTKGAYFASDGYLWVVDGSGESSWYFWIKPVDGVAQCINAGSPLVVSNA